MRKKLLLFDLDNTLWASDDSDYISSQVSDFRQVSGGVLQREADGKLFALRSDCVTTLNTLKTQGHTIGIVSDNEPRQTLKVLRAFDIDKFFDNQAVNIRLWDGYCPKHKMVNQLLKKSAYNTLGRENVWWFDDKDYTVEAKSIGVHFRMITSDQALDAVVREALATS